MTARRKGSRKKRGIFSLRFFILGLVALIFLIFAGQAVKVAKNAVWDGQNRINLIVDAQDLYLVSFDPEEKKLLIVKVLGETYVEAPYGFGFYPFGAIYDLGEIEKRGGEVLAATAQEFFATPVEGWIKVAGGPPKAEQVAGSKEELLGLLRQQILREGETNLTRWDLIRLWWEIRQVRFDGVRTLDLEKNQILKSDSLAKLDALLAPFLLESSIKEESLKIEVLNSTEKAGLGNRIGRLITNLGGEVINLGNYEEKLNHCLIWVKKENADKKTVLRLKKIFSCQIGQGDPPQTRADIVLIVGEDYGQKINPL